MWIAFLTYWALASRRVKRARRRERWQSQVLDTVLVPASSSFFSYPAISCRP